MLEQRVARLEGTYEQVDRRLGDLAHGLEQVRQELGGLRQEMHQEMTDFRRDLSSGLWRQTGLTVGTWITVMLALFLRH